MDTLNPHQRLHEQHLLLQNAERRVVVLERICIQQEQLINPLRREVERLKKQVEQHQTSCDKWNNLPWYQKLWVVAGI